MAKASGNKSEANVPDYKKDMNAGFKEVYGSPLEYADSDGDVRLRVGKAQSKEYAELVESWKSCERCPLSASRDKVVFVRGTIPADVLFIGEAPGPKEDEVGFPFVGPSGRLLSTIISELRKSRTGWEYAITNPVGCIPWARTENDQDPTTFRPPEPGEIEKCNPRFVTILKLVEPKGIVLLGKTAESFWSTYGNKLQEQTGKKYRILSTYHPSHLFNGGARDSNLHYRHSLSGMKQFLFQTLNVGKGD